MKRLFTAMWVWASAASCVLLMTAVEATAAQKSKPLENIPPRLHLAPAGTAPDRIAAAIALAAENQGWRIIEEAPGTLTAILFRRSHEAVVVIGYDETNFWIDYKDSKNLNYTTKARKRRTKGQVHGGSTGPRIHPNYNQWVAELADEIVLRTQRPPEPNGEPARLIADELEKLDELRQRGVLTQEEFDARKAKLLAQ
ncbi:MAG: SHOCT domain-containing protein [Deltaproteobacteria bacterium]|nr:SHOCT domain-containing protein [Deltaproteobacteria bacterium]MBW2541134.1 SHOCT domain-containing protein [Deltaproteobacteria bacterium]